MVYRSRRTVYGFRLEPDPWEQATIRIVRAKRREGTSLQAISKWLAENGRFARDGRPFAKTQLARMLRMVTAGQKAEAPNAAAG